MPTNLAPKAKSVLASLENYSRTHDRVYSIPRSEAEFLHLLVKLSRPKRILELGTSIGYSTIYLALAAKECGGKVVTIEFDTHKIAMARKNFKDAGVEKTIKLIEGDINVEVKKLKGKFDFVFMDSEKEEYLKHFNMCLPKLSKKALVAADNAGDLALHMQDYLDHVRNSKKLSSVFVNIGNGLELTYKQ